MKKKYLSLPKEYLSYSQMALWMRDPKQYKDIYFDQREELRSSNAGMEYGKVVADALEHGIQTGDLLTDAAMLMLPKYDVADQEFFAETKTGRGWLKLLAKPDSLDSATCAFLEYKTGKNPWTAKAAQDHLQMHFYATVIYLKYKVVPPSAKLLWIETAWDDGVVTPTGRVEEFAVEFDMRSLLNTLGFMHKVAQEIEVAYASHITNPELLHF